MSENFKDKIIGIFVIFILLITIAPVIAKLNPNLVWVFVISMVLLLIAGIALLFER